MITEKDVEKFKELQAKIFKEIKKDMIGQEDVIKQVVTAMIAGGNVLLEGVPGVGKTRLVRVLSRVFSMQFSRIQFTPDLMPADIIGTNIVTQDEKKVSKFQFHKGPLFSNIVLADEINRATPKTQSALLEAMQEKKVTVMGKTYQLPQPFFVLATQNPIDQDGTYPLPEAQMDRFMFKTVILPPNLDELKDIVCLTQKVQDETAKPVVNQEELLSMKKVANEILVSDELLNYAMRLVLATHPTGEYKSKTAEKYVELGASPRAGQALISASKVNAMLDGRYNISKNDIDMLIYPTIRGRVKLNFEAISDGVSPDDVITQIKKEVKI